MESSTENVSVDIPLTTINGLFPTAGTYHLKLHGKDVAGNWGSVIDVLLIIDKTVPTINTPRQLPTR